ncbi:hypothetical protein A1O7_09260 [Cladophialophora yegresii CBS 114405]|uniref:Transcription factor domain-containing protein n=1 Tax=Cladophialophora yegresii CBS 114405 TaxID=1182544 RepID=W9W5T2_9EURO|nr:uncharacterized protein A1O7_09260 [Cladophialophora yegresii CBS 114405]EXJ53924.1 hypothetical protein A1O7_09260 [Cladophialophora yegresii CBS 114405]
MKVLFISCDGQGQARKTSSDEGVTRCQHAAREYHKTAKLRRARNKAQPVHKFRKPVKPLVNPTDEPAVPELKLEQHLPIQVLLGASRSDPFNTIGDAGAPLYVHEMLDHAITSHWSELCLTDGEGLNAARAEMMQSVMYSPIAWYTIVFAGATHNAYQYGGRGTTKQNEQLRLVYKTKAISSLLEYIQENSDTVSEEALLSMITLASHGTGENLKGHDAYKRQKLPFLSHLHDVEYYASMDIGMEHLTAVYSIVDQRGGLLTLRRRSLAIIIQLCDIMTAWRGLQRPHFGLLVPTNVHISKRTHEPDVVAQAMLRTRTTGFRTLISNGYAGLDHLVEVADHTSIFSADFDQLLRCYDLPKEQQPLHTPKIALVRYMRWCVLHDILMLPEHLIDDESLPEQVVHEICRHILFAYAVFVVVPMPLKTKLHAKIAEQLARILTRAIKVGVPSQHQGLFHCAVAWGWMCAEKAVGYRKREKLLGSFATLLEFTRVPRKPDSWPIVEEIMRSFLWMEAYCDEPGRKFWANACGQAEDDFKVESP